MTIQDIKQAPLNTKEFSKRDVLAVLSAAEEDLNRLIQLQGDASESNHNNIYVSGMRRAQFALEQFKKDISSK
ncbi:hypothetical protein [Kistimonas asteriae]|uniref:hypothetical protein n=1 Tax=Kistimonas asteriae TaxID=517724 RepID=UPI001BACEC6F|nr:hypothetical protein [Kistimonas asteriae]